MCQPRLLPSTFPPEDVTLIRATSRLEVTLCSPASPVLLLLGLTARCTVHGALKAPTSRPIFLAAALVPTTRPGGLQQSCAAPLGAAGRLSPWQQLNAKRI